MGLLDKWNKNKFSIYKSEEKTVLKLIESIGKWVEDLIKVTENKTDLHGDHKGSWQGLNRPTLSEEGMRATVEQLIDETIPNIETQLADIVTHNRINVKNPPAGLTPCKGDAIIGNQDTLTGIRDVIGTDDTEALQAINDYALANKKSLFFPAGVYKITRPIRLTAMGIFGESWKETIIMYAGEKNESATMVDMKGIMGRPIDNILLDGNYSIGTLLNTDYPDVGPSINNSYTNITLQRYLKKGWSARNNNDCLFETILTRMPEFRYAPNHECGLDVYASGGPINFNNCNFLDVVRVASQRVTFKDCVTRGIELCGGWNMFTYEGGYMYKNFHKMNLINIEENTECNGIKLENPHCELVDLVCLVGGKGKLNNGLICDVGHIFNGGSSDWTSGKYYNKNTSCSSNGNIYIAVTSGVAGSTPPSGTTIFDDGGVTWKFVRAKTEPGTGRLLDENVKSSYVDKPSFNFHNTWFNNMTLPTLTASKYKGFTFNYKDCFYGGIAFTDYNFGTVTYATKIRPTGINIGYNSATDGISMMRTRLADLGNEWQGTGIKGIGVYMLLINGIATVTPKAIVTCLKGGSNPNSELINIISQQKGLGTKYANMEYEVRFYNGEIQIRAVNCTGSESYIPSVEIGCIYTSSERQNISQ